MSTSTEERTASALSPAPRLEGSWFMGHVPSWRRDPLALLTEAARCGDHVRLWLMRPVHVLYHPDHVRHVLQDNEKNYRKGWAFEALKPYWGEGLFTAEGQAWRRQRKLLQPAFHRQHHARFATIVVERTEEMLDRWEQRRLRNEKVILLDEMTQLALVIIAEALFGIELIEEGREMAVAAQQAFAIMLDRLGRVMPLPFGVPTPTNLKFRRSMATIDRVFRQIVDKHQHAPNADATLLTLLMDAVDEDGGGKMSPELLRDEAIGVLTNAHDTPAEMLSWLWYLLSLHPAVERQVFEEVTAGVPGRATLEDIPRLPYTSRVLQESLRLRSPAYVIPRQSIEADVVGGHPIPANTVVMLSPYVTHRHPGFWENPEGFDPDRFLPERTADRPKFAYFPFGAGPRGCIGQHLAMLEAQLVVATIIKRFRLDLVPGQREEAECILDMRPRYGVPVTLHPRGTPERCAAPPPTGVPRTPSQARTR